MTAMARVNVAWQNWPGAPGLSQFYFDIATGMQANVDALRAFFDAVKALLPSGMTITVPGSGDMITAETGVISGNWSVGTPPTAVTATGTGSYAGNAGAVVHWLTGTVVNGRRVRGRTFLVPGVNMYEANGSLVSTALTTIQTAANTLITTTTPRLEVWSRPVEAHTEYDRKTGQATSIPARAGSVAVVNGYRVPDLSVSLRSRRI